ncbi:YjdF family protein [Sediminispirochaeta bajacaliforniensis]|uniref:YjdF family protein n=1 Tax=Sediminispirochaeta bajacaliforniensis TaxID=148 RepID=UPI00035E0518|nr:YjdF family protein [Sediminispirochaeta bajacaliforniensis]
MDTVVSTIFFNGQFWVALVEKRGEDGTLSVAKHTFGPEPTNNDILDFYFNSYLYLRFYACQRIVRAKKRLSGKEEKRSLKKSLDVHKEEQREVLLARKKEQKVRCRADANEQYRRQCEKRKEKRRGH